MPVGRVNDFNPLMHSGQERLQAVVGSTDIEKGKPQTTGFLTKRLIYIKITPKKQMYIIKWQVFTVKAIKYKLVTMQEKHWQQNHRMEKLIY